MTAPATVLCWVFERDANALTCELDAEGRRSFDVVIVPHWNVDASVTEHFDALSDAVLRHAEIARRLREDGWAVTSHVRPHYTHTPMAA